MSKLQAIVHAEPFVDIRLTTKEAALLKAVLQSVATITLIQEVEALIDLFELPELDYLNDIIVRTSDDVLHVNLHG